MICMQVDQGGDVGMLLTFATELCVGAVLVLCWCCVGAVLVLCWCCVGTVLVLCCALVLVLCCVTIVIIVEN